MNFSYFAIMFMVALIAGFINVVSGGGGFLSIGALLLSGLPPANALATNKIQALGSSLTSGIYFLRRGHINVQQHKYVFLSAFVGSALGTTLIQFIEPELLKKLLPVLIIAVALYFIFAPNLTEPKKKQQVSLFLFSLIGEGALVSMMDSSAPGPVPFIPCATSCCGDTASIKRKFTLISLILRPTSPLFCSSFSVAK